MVYVSLNSCVFMIIEVQSVSFIFRLLILFIALLMSSSHEGRKPCGLRVVSDPQPVAVTKLCVDLGHCSLCFSDGPLGERRQNYEHPGFCFTFPFQPAETSRKITKEISHKVKVHERAHLLKCSKLTMFKNHKGNQTHATHIQNPGISKIVIS